jgi:hypothetical protein
MSHRIVKEARVVVAAGLPRHCIAAILPRQVGAVELGFRIRNFATAQFPSIFA